MAGTIKMLETDLSTDSELRSTPTVPTLLPDSVRRPKYLQGGSHRYSTICTSADPMPRTPVPAQLLSRFVPPENVIVYAITCVQLALPVAEPPENVRL